MIPFGVIDEAVHLLDTEAEPWSIQLELRVGGALDEDRLRGSVSHALASHPMARARKAPTRPARRRDSWQIPGRVDLDPVQVVDCPDDRSLDDARAQLQSLAVPLAESPPLRLRLARHPAGDVVMANVNHAAMDGFGVLAVMRSVARAYAGWPNPEPEPEPPSTAAFLEARELPVRLVEVDAPTRLRRHLALAARLSDLLSPPARIAPDGASDEPGYGLHHLPLSVDQTAAIAELDHRGTANDVLLGALHLAIADWNSSHGMACGRISVLVPANLRRGPAHQDMVGNFSLPARVSTTTGQRRSPAAALDAVVAQTRRKKRSGLGTALVELVGRSDRFPLWLKRALVMLLPLTGNRMVDTAILSNLGRLEAAVSFGDAGDATEIWFSPPARMPLGLAVGVVTMAGSMHVALRYCRRLFDADAAARFARCYGQELSRLLTTPAGDAPGPGPPLGVAWTQLGRAKPPAHRPVAGSMAHSSSCPSSLNLATKTCSPPEPATVPTTTLPSTSSDRTTTPSPSRSSRTRASLEKASAQRSHQKWYQ